MTDKNDELLLLVANTAQYEKANINISSKEYIFVVKVILACYTTVFSKQKKI